MQRAISTGIGSGIIVDGRLLLGARGEAQKDIDSVVSIIIKLGALISKCPIISDIEINPLTVYEQGDGAKALDVRILLAKEGDGKH